MLVHLALKRTEASPDHLYIVSAMPGFLVRLKVCVCENPPLLCASARDPILLHCSSSTQPKHACFLYLRRKSYPFAIILWPIGFADTFLRSFTVPREY